MSGAFVSYGVDDFMTIGLFYLMLSPLPDRLSLDWLGRKVRPGYPWSLGFFVALYSFICLSFIFLVA